MANQSRCLLYNACSWWWFSVERQNTGSYKKRSLLLCFFKRSCVHVSRVQWAVVMVRQEGQYIEGPSHEYPWLERQIQLACPYCWHVLIIGDPNHHWLALYWIIQGLLLYQGLQLVYQIVVFQSGRISDGGIQISLSMAVFQPSRCNKNGLM